MGFKKKMSFLVLFVSSLFVFGIQRVTASENTDDGLSVVNTYNVGEDRATNRGNGGITKVQIQNGGYRVWVYASTQNKKNFYFAGKVTVTFKNNRKKTYLLSENSSSGSFTKYYYPGGKVKKAEMAGIAYINGTGLALTFPFADTYYGG